ncbi:coil containing protein [Vibrio phage 1.193.O._10N.286.52.C6]|nr:coil containing protein [Vibrio phage 1.193.O._10N.286.52.C6]
MSNIDKVVDYEVGKEGGHITLQFKSGYVTRRKCYNKQDTVSRTCDFSGVEIKPNEIFIYVAIKKRGFSRYRLSLNAVNRCLSGEDFTEINYVSETHKQLENFMQECRTQRKQFNEEDRNLREAIREIKFKNSKLGKQMSAARHLIELITEG